MTAHAQIDWPTLAEPVARIVWGAPSTETKDELRWGSRGSRALNRAKGTWFDHEANCGGGTLDLVPGSDVDERIQWLRERRLIEDPLRSNRGGNGSAGSFNIIATYDYTDETGALLFQVCRLVPKDFRQRRPDGKGGWVWKLGDVRRVLYRLSELCEAIDQRQTIYVVEGEKDVESLRKLGLVATCNPGGANKWRPEYSHTLRGADVVIIGDNDYSGHQHVTQVTADLYGVVGRLRVLNLARVDKPAKDISAWFDGGGDAATLQQLIEALPEWQPQTGGTQSSSSEQLSDAEIENVIAGLADLSEIAYQRQRSEAAKRIGMPVAIIDKLAGNAAPGLRTMPLRCRIGRWSRGTSQSPLLTYWTTSRRRLSDT